jgi:hypothetical protein
MPVERDGSAIRRQRRRPTTRSPVVPVTTPAPVWAVWSGRPRSSVSKRRSSAVSSSGAVPHVRAGPFRHVESFVGGACKIAPNRARRESSYPPSNSTTVRQSNSVRLNASIAATALARETRSDRIGWARGSPASGAWAVLRRIAEGELALRGREPI